MTRILILIFCVFSSFYSYAQAVLPELTGKRVIEFDMVRDEHDEIVGYYAIAEQKDGTSEIVTYDHLMNFLEKKGSMSDIEESEIYLLSHSFILSKKQDEELNLSIYNVDQASPLKKQLKLKEYGITGDYIVLSHYLTGLYIVSQDSRILYIDQNGKVNKLVENANVDLNLAIPHQAKIAGDFLFIKGRGKGQSGGKNGNFVVIDLEKGAILKQFYFEEISENTSLAAGTVFANKLTVLITSYDALPEFQVLNYDLNSDELQTHKEKLSHSPTQDFPLNIAKDYLLDAHIYENGDLYAVFYADKKGFSFSKEWEEIDILRYQKGNFEFEKIEFLKAEMKSNSREKLGNTTSIYQLSTAGNSILMPIHIFMLNKNEAVENRKEAFLLSYILEKGQVKFLPFQTKMTPLNSKILEARNGKVVEFYTTPELKHIVRFVDVKKE